MNYTCCSHTLPQALRTPEAAALYKALNKTTAKTLFVGGCVRAALLGEAVTDIDLATTLLPQAVAKRLESIGFSIFPIGLEHGTILAVKNQKKFEITTLRKDIHTDGRHATVAFTKNFEEDAARRDLTFNALYMTLEGDVFDSFGGIKDLHQGHVRFVGDAATRLQEDWLRALRFMRFYGHYGQTPPDKTTLKALQVAASFLKTLSPERKTAELLKIAALSQAEKSFSLIADVGFLDALEMANFSLKHFIRFKNLWPEATALAKLAAGFWQPTTPQPLLTFSKNPHFRFSSAEKDFLRAINPLKTAGLYSQNPHYSTWLLGGEVKTIALWQQAAAHTPKALRTDVHTALDGLKAPHTPCPITGSDLKNMGLPANKTLGHHLKNLQRLWATGCFKNKEDLLKELTPSLETTNVFALSVNAKNIAAFNAFLTSSAGKKAAHIFFFLHFPETPSAVFQKQFSALFSTLNKQPNITFLYAGEVPSFSRKNTKTPEYKRFKDQCYFLCTYKGVNTATLRLEGGQTYTLIAANGASLDLEKSIYTLPLPKKAHLELWPVQVLTVPKKNVVQLTPEKLASLNLFKGLLGMKIQL